MCPHLGTPTANRSPAEEPGRALLVQCQAEKGADETTGGCRVTCSSVPAPSGGSRQRRPPLAAERISSLEKRNPSASPQSQGSSRMSVWQRFHPSAPVVVLQHPMEALDEGVHHAPPRRRIGPLDLQLVRVILVLQFARPAWATTENYVLMCNSFCTVPIAHPKNASPCSRA